MSSLYISLLPANAGMAQELRQLRERDLMHTPVPACLTAFANQESAFGQPVSALVRDWITVDAQLRTITAAQVAALVPTHYRSSYYRIPRPLDLLRDPTRDALVVQDGKIVSGISLYRCVRLLAQFMPSWANAKFSCIYISEKR